MSALTDRRPIGPVRSAPAILGCGSIGGIGSAPAGLGGGLSKQDAFEVMDAAVEIGINVFDTADGYAGGESERVIGAWLAQRQADVTVVTKVGVAWDRPSLRDLSPERIRAHSATSRSRLGLDRIEMYMAHAPDKNTPIEQSLKAFDELYQQGLIASLGLCNVDVPILQEWQAQSARHGAIAVSWVQNEYNLMCQRDTAQVIPYCLENRLAYTAYSPLAGGILTGRYRSGEPAPPGSRVAVLPEQYGPRADHATLRSVQALAAEADRRGVSCTALSLAWVMSAPGVAAPLVAPKTPSQLSSVAEAAGLSLSGDDRATLAALFAN